MNIPNAPHAAADAISQPQKGTAADSTARKTARRGWLVPAGLIALAFIPVAAGASRVAQLVGGVTETPDNARFVDAPVPVSVHVAAVTVYSLLGAFQFAAAFRRRRPGWHRAAGRILVPAGLLVALSGLWMALFYPHPADTGALLTGIRVVVGTAMAAAIVLGFAAVRRRDIARHQAWMTRAYALAMGAGTQVFTQLPWMAAFGTLDRLSKALLMLLGWAINIAVAEWLIRRRPDARRSVTAPATTASATATVATPQPLVVG